MSKTLLQKMFVKPNYALAILHTPEELKASLLGKNEVATHLTDSYSFILSFYVKKKDFEQEVGNLKKSLSENGLLWIAYPKNKALETDLKRDILHSLMKEHRLDGVSLISLNDTWSVMRFKKI